MDPDVLSKAFKIFDTNHDGKITIDELKKVMNNCEMYPSNLELCFAMNQGDIDHDGVITYSEFMHFMLNHPKKIPKKYSIDELHQQFQLFDKDGDNFINCEEMIELIAKLHIDLYFPQTLIKKLFHEADTNDDGKISFDEFQKAIN